MLPPNLKIPSLEKFELNQPLLFISYSVYHI